MPNKNSESIGTRGSVAFFLTGCRSPPALKIAKKCPTRTTQTKTAQNKISSRREGNSADKVVIHSHALVTKECFRRGRSWPQSSGLFCFDVSCEALHRLADPTLQPALGKRPQESDPSAFELG